MSKAGVGASVVGPHSLFNINGEKIGQLAQKYKLPAASLQSSVLRGGGVMPAGPDFEKVWISGARIIDKIAKGTKPADIPVDQLTPFKILINVKAIHALGLNVPKSMPENAQILP
jgi:putative tryptophan/tyrosine transport system substrate-binding protein